MRPRFLLLTVGAAAITLAGCGKKEETKGGPPPPAQVEVYVTEEKTVPVSTTFIGQTEANQNVEVRARVTGVVWDIAFKEGTTVTQGQYLYRIDPRPFEANLQIVKAQEFQAQVSVQQAERDLRRTRALLQSQSVPQEEVDDATAAYENSVAALRLAEANVANTELELSFTTVTAPITGMVGEAQKRVGDLVDTGQNSLLVNIVSQDPIFVNFFMSERELLDYNHAMESGRLVLPEDGKLQLEISLIDGTVYPALGEINFRDVRIDPQTGTALVRALFPNKRSDLLPGMFVRIRTIGLQRPNTVLVPQRAVNQGMQGSNVLVVGSDGTVEMRPVKPSDWLGKAWIIESGLEGGEQVIVNGVQKAQPGSKVEVTTVTRTLDLSASEPPLGPGVARPVADQMHPASPDAADQTEPDAQETTASGTRETTSTNEGRVSTGTATN